VPIKPEVSPSDEINPDVPNPDDVRLEEDDKPSGSEPNPEDIRADGSDNVEKPPSELVLMSDWVLGTDDNVVGDAVVEPPDMVSIMLISKLIIFPRSACSVPGVRDCDALPDAVGAVLLNSPWDWPVVLNGVT
jgi:hypothetical protein